MGKRGATGRPARRGRADRKRTARVRGGAGAGARCAGGGRGRGGTWGAEPGRTNDSGEGMGAAGAGRGSPREAPACRERGAAGARGAAGCSPAREARGAAVARAKDSEEGSCCGHGARSVSAGRFSPHRLPAGPAARPAARATRAAALARPAGLAAAAGAHTRRIRSRSGALRVESMVCPDIRGQHSIRRGRAGGRDGPYERTGASPRRLASMSASWSSTQSPGSRAVTIRFRPCARQERSSADIDSAR
jgi:hypothetical protein